MSKFIISGGHKLKGKIRTNSAKNSAVAILCATPLIKGKSTLIDVPRIEEVFRIIEILESIGLKIKWIDEHSLEIINDQKFEINNINKESFIKTRSGLLLLGSLPPIIKDFTLPKASGCQLGKRTVNAYLIALEYLGIKISETNNQYKVTTKKIIGSEFTMYEAGDTATEAAIMSAVLASGTTTIHFPAANYMVQDLCIFLQKAGADISGIGSKKIIIKGVKNLSPIQDYPIMPDPIEAMAFISLAITTGSKLTIENCPIDFLRLELEKLKAMGQKFTIINSYKSKNNYFDLVDIEIFPSKLYALPDKIHALPYPGINIDNLALFLPILTQAEGSTLVHDWVYENRAIYYIELSRMGANIMLHDPHRVTVTGKTKLHSAEIICPPALRPSINLLICMIAAKGKSILRNSYPIDRGYEDIYQRLNKLGAKIERIN